MVTDEISLKSLLVLYGTGPSYQDLWTSLVANLSHVIERRDPASRRIAAAMVGSTMSETVNPNSSPAGVGWHDVASAAWLLFPRRWTISNAQGRVRCLRRKRRVLEISSSVRSPKIFTKGL